MHKLNKEQSIYLAVKDSALTFPNHTALIYQGHKYSYSHLLKRINQFANYLITLGVNKDEPITICLPNIPDAVYLLYAVNQIGAIANLVHPLLTYEQMKEILDITKSKYLFCLDSKYKVFNKFIEDGINVYACSPTSELTVFEMFFYHLKMHKKIGVIPNEHKMNRFYMSARYEDADERYLNDAIYLHSGGTSGKPKTVALSSFALNSIDYYGPWILGLESLEKQCILAVLPMFHGFGLCMGIHAMLTDGGTDVLMPKFSPKQCVRYIRKNQLNVLLGVPIVYEALCDTRGFYGKKLTNLNNAFVGGDFVPSSLLERFDRRMIKFGSICRLREGYGLTEVVNVCAVNTHAKHKDGSVGTGLPCVKFKIIDPVTSEILPYNKEGELVIGGDSIMNGYRFNEDPKANEKVFMTIDGEKYVHTGDYCMLDEDNFLHFKTRLKRIIKVNGVPVFPLVIEEICSSFEFVYEAVVKGVKDEKRGHVVKLFIVLNKHFNIEQEKAKQILIDKIVSSQGVYAKPKEVVFIEKLPHTIIGKVDVNALPD